MADLDDFFAKKDRKKKTTKKFTTTEEVAKNLEDTAKKTEKQKKERVPEGEEDNTQINEQDEWKEFEEEKKDYTGLKIGNLTINPGQEQTVNQESGSGEQQEGGESGSESDRKAGPWKRMDVQSDTPTNEEPAPPRPVVEKKPEPASQGNVYRPPALMRNSQPQNTAPTRLRGPKGVAPDIHNQDFFPSLGGDKKNKGEGSFEVVRQDRASSSYRQHVEQQRGQGGGNLKLDNRYTGLSNDS